MSIHPYSDVTCGECTDFEALYNWDGEFRGFICKQDGEFHVDVKCGSFAELGCHSMWELEGDFDE